MPEFAKETVAVSLEEEMRRSYLDYAMSVIVGRALPDVRDGLKPVHRRILFSAQESGFYYNRPYRKSARIVGDRSAPPPTVASMSANVCTTSRRAARHAHS